MNNSSLNRYLAGKVVEARRHAGLGRLELSRLLGVCPRLVAYWETGEREPRLKDLLALLALADLSLAWLFSGLEEDLGAYHPAAQEAG